MVQKQFVVLQTHEFMYWEVTKFGKAENVEVLNFFPRMYGQSVMPALQLYFEV